MAVLVCMEYLCLSLDLEAGISGRRFTTLGSALKVETTDELLEEVEFIPLNNGAVSDAKGQEQWKHWLGNWGRERLGESKSSERSRDSYISDIMSGNKSHV